MKRFVACLMSVVLVIGLAPLPASATTSGNLHAASVLETAAAAGPVDTTFASKQLYDAVVEQLKAQGIAYTADDSTRNVKLTAENNARFTRLEANHQHIKDISGLEAFTALEWIDLSNNLVKTSSQFSNMANLAYLDLYDNAVRDLGGLRNLTRLEHLNLGDNDEVSRTTMANLDALETLTSLKWLDFSRNETPEVTGHIKNLKTLTHLNLAKNNLKDVGDLAGLTNMKSLNLSWNDPLAGISAVKNMTELEELECAFTHLNRSYVKDGVEQYGTDKSGINELFGTDGKLLLKKLKKIDLLADWNTSFANDNGANAVPNAHVRELYRMFKAGELEQYGYFYTWFDVASDSNFMRTENIMHTDANGVKYITYEDFDAYCDGAHDDFFAIFNAHKYANTYGCEVRSTVNAADAPGKTFHIYGYYDALRDFSACTNVDWQNANFVVHDEYIDHYPARHKQLMLVYSGPTGSTESTTPRGRMKTIDNPTINAGRSLGTSSTSIAGLSPELDAAIAELRGLGYERFYVMVTNENKRQYMRHEGLDDITWNGFAQWDGFTVKANGAIETYNASTMLPHGTAQLSSADYHVTDAIPALQWDFDGITKLEVVPIPAQQAYVKNAHFVTIPLAANAETPRDGGGKPDDYRRCLDFRFCANIEVANITQQLGYEETGYDHNELSGSYYGFFTMNDSACIDFHDCTAWDRRTITSSYGVQLYQLVDIRLTNVKASNPTEDYLIGASGDRWGLTGDNYCKHLLFDHCIMGRIDAHMGFYDVAIRDCRLGTGGLCLTGQGPLTVERTETHSNSFMNLRSDYGSTWDGDAHINDCTQYYVRSKTSPQPGNFVAITARFDDAEQKTRHDFGYPLRHPNLYVNNFTLDDRYFFGSDTEYYGTYGIVSDYINGLQLYRNDDAKYGAYWPDAVQFNGLHLVNYQDSLGYERHVRMPLKMYGPAIEKLANYSVRNVTYNGKALSADLSEGENLVDVPFELVQERKAGDEVTLARVIVDQPFTAEQLGDKDLVIEYTGDEPDLAFTDIAAPYYGSNDHWIVVKPYFVEHRWNASKTAYTDVAYFSNAEIQHRWSDRKAAFAELQPISRINIRTAALESSIGGTTTGKVTEGKTTLTSVKLLDVHKAVDNGQGNPGQQDPSGEQGSTDGQDPSGNQESDGQQSPSGDQGATNGQVPSGDQPGNPSAHVHSWSAWKTVRPATCSIAGVEQRTCTTDSTHVETRSVAALGHAWEASYTVDVAPTARKAGRESIHCKRCSVVRGSRSIPKLKSKKSAKAVQTQPVYRLVNFTTGQRRYLTSESTVRKLMRTRWRLEGVAFNAPVKGGKPVWQLQRAGRYVYTAKASEVTKFKRAGWKSKKTVFRAPASGGVKVYRMYNKKADAYLLTKKTSEVKSLKKSGWKSQGAVFRAVS